MNKATFIDKIEILLENEEYEEATDKINKYLLEHPDDMQVQYLLAECIYSQGRFLEAIVASNQILMHDKCNIDAVSICVSCYFELGNYHNALQLLQDCCEKCNDVLLSKTQISNYTSGHFLFQYWMALSEMGNHTRALTIADIGMRDKRDRALWQGYRQTSLIMLRRYEDALNCYGLDADSKRRALLDIAYNLSYQADYSKAMHFFQEYIASNNDEEEIFLVLPYIQCLLSAGHADEVILQYNHWRQYSIPETNTEEYIAINLLIAFAYWQKDDIKECTAIVDTIRKFDDYSVVEIIDNKIAFEFKTLKKTLSEFVVFIFQ